MSILVIADHDGNVLKSTTGNAVSAALKIGSDIDLLVAGENIDKIAAQAAKINGLTKVIAAEAPALSHGLAESVAPIIHNLSSSYSHILAAATSFGKNVLPRAAALADSQQISDITAVIDANTFERPVYAGNAVATVQSNDAIKFITVRTSAFDLPDMDTGSAETVPLADLSAAEQDLSAFVSQKLSKSNRPELTAADIVVSGGRGVGSSEDFKLIEALADKLGGAVGASRAAVDAGYVPNDYQVGQTGKIVAPGLYIAVGISGAIQHLAGMKDSKVIVAINKDEEAPIFQVADYGLVADLFDAVPELTEKL